MTFREVAWMVDGKLTATWEQASYLMATVMNCAMGAKQPVHPWQVNPYRKQESDEAIIDQQLASFFGIEME